MFSFEYAAFLRHGHAYNNQAEERYNAGDLSAYDVNITRPPSFHRLTERGVRQAIMTGDWLKRNGFKFRHYVVSPYLRAIETAYRLNIPEAEWEIDNRFSEKNSGVFHEMTPLESEAYRNTVKNQVTEIDPYMFIPDRGQSFYDVEMIIRSGLISLKDSTITTCHGHVMRVLDHVVMGGKHSWDMGTRKEAMWECPNCAFIEYTRRCPFTNELYNNRWWRRMSLPVEDRLGTWEEILRPRLNNDALIALVEKVSSRLDLA